MINAVIPIAISDIVKHDGFLHFGSSAIVETLSSSFKSGSSSMASNDIRGTRKNLWKSNLNYIEMIISIH